jgi:hypothetical protein
MIPSLRASTKDAHLEILKDNKLHKRNKRLSGKLIFSRFAQKSPPGRGECRVLYPYTYVLTHISPHMYIDTVPIILLYIYICTVLYCTGTLTPSIWRDTLDYRPTYTHLYYVPYMYHTHICNVWCLAAEHCDYYIILAKLRYLVPSFPCNSLS